MSSRITIFRTVAIAILLLTGAELFACDLLSPATCEIAGIPNADSPKPSDGDSCLCCCFHVIVSPQIKMTPTFETATTLVTPACEIPLVEPAHVYHPPRV